MVLFCVFVTCVQDLLLSIVLSSKNAVAIVGMIPTVASIQISFKSSSKTCTEKSRKDLRIIEPSVSIALIYLFLKNVSAATVKELIANVSVGCKTGA